MEEIADISRWRYSCSFGVWRKKNLRQTRPKGGSMGVGIIAKLLSGLLGGFIDAGKCEMKNRALEKELKIANARVEKVTSELMDYIEKAEDENQKLTVGTNTISI